MIIFTSEKLDLIGGWIRLNFLYNLYYELNSIVQFKTQIKEMRLRNLSIRIRLTIAFAILVLFVALVGLVNHYSLNQTSKIVNEVKNLATAEKNLQSARLKVMYFIKFTDIAAAAEALDFIDLAIKGVDYQKTIADDNFQN